MFQIVFAFPAPGASDVVQRELSVTVNGADPPLIRTYSNVMQSDTWDFQENDSLACTLTDIDNAGNRSQPSSVFNYDVVDDVPPPQPAELGIASKTEV